MEPLDSRLPGAAVVLDPATLVRPGVSLVLADGGHGEQVLEPALRRH